MKIFMGLTEVAGYYANLQKGFQELGTVARFMDLTGQSAKYATPEPSRIVRLTRYCSERAGRPASSRLTRSLWWKARQLLVAGVFVHAVFTYQVFIFGYRSTFFSYRELPFLRWLRKRIVFVFHGDDGRPPYLSGVHMPAGIPDDIDRCIERTRSVKQILRRIEAYADIIIANPLSAQLHEKPFVDFGTMGLPCRFHPPPEVTPAPAGATRILHAPSDPAAKGTERIREAIGRLKAKGRSIDYVEIRGQPNAIVIQELQRCDFVIDQLYSDVRMAGFAAEAAALGKPAVVGSYASRMLERQDRETQPGLPPVELCSPEDIEAAIDRLILDREHRLELGRRAKEFVLHRWAAKHVAERYLDLLKGPIPEERLTHPSEIRYVHGASLSEARVVSLVRGIVAKGGKEALQLSDKPELERLLIQLSEKSTPHIEEIAAAGR